MLIKCDDGRFAEKTVTCGRETTFITSSRAVTRYFLLEIHTETDKRESTEL